MNPSKDKRKKKKSKIKTIYDICIDEEGKLIFTTMDNKKYAYKYYTDASGAVSEITLEELI